MVVLLIVLALGAQPCETTLQPITVALQRNDIAGALSLLESIPAECAASSSFYSLAGVTYELSGRTSDAEAALIRANTLDPKSARLKEQLGATYLRNKKPAEAAAILREAVTLDPANVTAKKYLIGACVETGSWTEAAALFDQIGGKSSAASDPILLLWYARTLIGTRQFDRIDHDFSPSAEMQPALLFSLGTLFAQHGLYERAARFLREIPEKDADDAVYFNLGLAYSHLQEYDEARRCYFFAIDRHPEHTDAYFRIGLDYGAAGKPRKALPWLFRAHQWAPSRADIAYSLVEQLIQLKYFDTAQQILLETRSSDLLVLVAQADLKLASGDTDNSLKAYRKIVAEQPGFAPALVGLARADLAEGKDDEARSSLLAALSNDSNDPNANGELGLIEARQKDWTSALKHLTKSWEHDKSNPAIALELSGVDRHIDHPDEALKVLTAVRPMMQESSTFHLELSRVFDQLHLPSQAQAEREEVATLQAQAQAGLHFDDPKVYVH